LDRALFHRREQRGFARLVFDRLVVGPFPARDRLGKREPLRRKGDEIGERGVVAVCARAGGAERNATPSVATARLARMACFIGTFGSGRRGRGGKTRRIDEDGRAAERRDSGYSADAPNRHRQAVAARVQSDLRTKRSEKPHDLDRHATVTERNARSLRRVELVLLVEECPDVLGQLGEELDADGLRSGLITCSGGGMRVGLSSMIVSPAGSIIINLALGFMPEANR
jgi:hypothetical protein